MRYILKMLSAFAAGLYLVVKSGDLAADGKPVSAFLLGLVVFALFAWMAWLSVEAERAARAAAKRNVTLTMPVTDARAVEIGDYLRISGAMNPDANGLHEVTDKPSYREVTVRRMR